MTVLNFLIHHHAGSAEQLVIVATGVIILAVTAWRYSRRPDYRKIHRMERQIGYRNLTAIPERHSRRRGRH